jgi:hypothetical protein
MRYKNLFAFLFVCSSVCVSLAQNKKYDLSQSIDLKQTGVNKVLCMKNGNTMLFHFEPHKALVVKIFDSLHKEIASKEHLCRIVDLYKLKDATFKGLYDVNGEGVLFIEQEHLSKYGLVRLRFNSSDATLIEEKLVDESKSLAKRTEFDVMKDKNDDGYAILLFTDVRTSKECDAFVRYYNGRHETLKEVTLDIDRKNYDFAAVLGAEIQSNGICISLDLSKLKMNGGLPGSSRTTDLGTPNIYDHNMVVYFIANGSTTAKKCAVDVGTNLPPYYSNYTYNALEHSLNLLLLSYKQASYQVGLGWQPAAVMANLFFRIDERDMSLGFKQIKNQLANNYLQEKTDTSNFYVGLPAKLFTNENGLSTMVSEYCFMQGNLEGQSKYGRNSYLGNICVTQFDDDGNEIWGIVLPKAQFHRSLQRYYYLDEISKKWQGMALFDDTPEAAYRRQFLSINNYCRNKNFFIIYNDVNKNFNNSISHPGDTVYSFENTNTCYYKINKQKEVTKNYLFGEPGTDEYKASFIEGADFDEQRGVYAALVQYKKGDDISLCMAWSRLD